MGASSTKPAQENLINETLLAPNADDNVEVESGIMRETTKHALITGLVLSVAVILIGLSVFFGVYQWKQSPEKAGICFTPACVHASSRIMTNLSPRYESVDPCTDFDQYVCGGWYEQNDMIENEKEIGTFISMAKNTQKQLRRVLESRQHLDELSIWPKTAASSDSSSVDQWNYEKLKNAYDACMDHDRIKTRKLEPLLNLLRQISIIDSDEAVTEVMIQLFKLGVSSLVDIRIAPDIHNPDTVIIHFSPPHLSMFGLSAKLNYEAPDMVKHYEEMLVLRLKTFFPKSVPVDNWRVLAHGLVELEQKLNFHALDNMAYQNIETVYYARSLDDFDNLLPKISLARIVREMAPSHYSAESINLLSIDYMNDLAKALSSTPRAVLQAFFVMRIVRYYESYVDWDGIEPPPLLPNNLTAEATVKFMDPFGSLPFLSFDSERWQICVNELENELPWILSRVMIEESFPSRAKDLGEQIILDVKDVFIQKLRSQKWMDESEIGLAIDKVHNIVPKIGYPTKTPNLRDARNVWEYYQSLNISNSTFFENMVEGMRFRVRQSWAQLGVPSDREAWTMSATSVNAYYNPSLNEIVFPAAIMQTPFFHTDAPNYLNYGAFGAIAGHELSHAFDPNGRHYDREGKYKDWWTPNTTAVFQQKADCFVRQFDDYTVVTTDNQILHVNGSLTVTENIADSGGLSAAFAAWQKRRLIQSDLDLPGLQYFTQEQLFFISFGNMWCGKFQDDLLRLLIHNDVHSPRNTRILGSVANSRVFKESFQCGIKEPVCELW